MTHGVQWLPKVDYILVLTNGEISESGTYEDLVEHDGPFAQFLQTYLTQQNDDDDDEDDDESKGSTTNNNPNWFLCLQIIIYIYIYIYIRVVQ